MFIYKPRTINSIVLKTMMGINEQNYSYQLFNIQGLLMNSGSFQNNATLNVSAYSKGLYLLEIMGNNESFVKKVVIK